MKMRSDPYPKNIVYRKWVRVRATESGPSKISCPNPNCIYIFVYYFIYYYFKPFFIKCLEFSNFVFQIFSTFLFYVIFFRRENII